MNDITTSVSLDLAGFLHLVGDNLLFLLFPFPTLVGANEAVGIDEIVGLIDGAFFFPLLPVGTLPLPTFVGANEAVGLDVIVGLIDGALLSFPGYSVGVIPF